MTICVENVLRENKALEIGCCCIWQRQTRSRLWTWSYRNVSRPAAGERAPSMNCYWIKGISLSTHTRRSQEGSESAPKHGRDHLRNWTVSNRGQFKITAYEGLLELMFCHHLPAKAIFFLIWDTKVKTVT